MPAGDAAEQVVNMTVKGVEVAANIAGRAAVSLASFLIAAIKNREKSGGKVSIKAFDGKPTKVFVIKGRDFKTFTAEAKQYGVKYAAVVSKKNKDGLVDIIVNAKDAARVNRIAERFALNTMEVEKIQKEQLAVEAKENKVNLNKEVIEGIQDNVKEEKNPMKARIVERNQSARYSENRENTTVTEQKSVRKQIKEIKQKRELKKPVLSNQKQRLTVHKQPRKKKRVKSR